MLWEKEKLLFAYSAWSEAPSGVHNILMMVHRPLRRPSFQLASHMRKNNVETQRGCDGNTAGILKTDYLVNRLLANSDPPISCLWPIPHKTVWSPCHIHKNTQFLPTRPATMLHMIHRCIHHEDYSFAHHLSQPLHPLPLPCTFLKTSSEGTQSSSHPVCKRGEYEAQPSSDIQVSSNISDHNISVTQQ